MQKGSKISCSDPDLDLEDFYTCFGVGEDDRHITTVDEGGVALAAIQGLNAMMKEKERRIQALEQDLADLKTLVNKLSAK